jgi:hypothetical protein
MAFVCYTIVLARLRFRTTLNSIDTPNQTEPTMYELQAAYTTQSQADAFVRTYNNLITLQTGRLAHTLQAGPGQYQVWLTL